MELALDIFATDDFKATTVTDMVGDIDYVPTELEDRGYFITRPVRTETITFIRRDYTLELVPTTERGTPEPLTTRQKRDALQIETPRIALRDRITAREAANLLNPALPYQVRLDNANALVAERQANMVDRIRLTRENHRFGALQGKILDADGVSVVANFFEEFGIVEPAEIALDIANTPDGALRPKLENLIVRPMKSALKGRWNAMTGVHAFVGDAFWDDLWKHSEVVNAFRNTPRATELMEARSWTRLEFAGIVFEHWDDGDWTELSIGTDKARFFPVGAYDTLYEFLAPGEDWEEIGAPGRDLYSVVSPDNRINMHEWTDVYVRTYPLYANKAPQSLLKARRGA